MDDNDWELFWFELLESASELDDEFGFQNWLENKKIDFEKSFTKESA